MKRDEFLRKLHWGLRPFCGKKYSEEIIEDYCEMFDTGQAQGLGEEALCAQFGAPGKAARTLLREYWSYPGHWLRLAAILTALWMALLSFSRQWWLAPWQILTIPWFLFYGREKAAALAPKKARLCLLLCAFACVALVGVFPVFGRGQMAVDWWVVHMGPLWRDTLLSLLRIVPVIGLAAVSFAALLILASGGFIPLFGCVGIFSALVREIVLLRDLVFSPAEIGWPDCIELVYLVLLGLFSMTVLALVQKKGADVLARTDKARNNASMIAGFILWAILLSLMFGQWIFALFPGYVPALRRIQSAAAFLFVPLTAWLLFGYTGGKSASLQKHSGLIWILYGAAALGLCGPLWRWLPVGQISWRTPLYFLYAGVASVSAIQCLALKGGLLGRALTCVNAGYAAAAIRTQWIIRSWDSPETYAGEIFLRLSPLLLGIVLGAVVRIIGVIRTRDEKRSMTPYVQPEK